MKLAQKIINTIGMNLELSNQTMAVEILRDIKEFYKKANKRTVLENELALCITEILLNHGDKQ